MSDRFTFLTQAINVVQSTTRAIDVKIGFLFVLVFLPSTQAKALKAYVQASSNAMGWEYVLLLIIAVAWMLSICMLFMSAGAISNSSEKVSGVKFYGFTIVRLFTKFRSKIYFLTLE